MDPQPEVVPWIWERFDNAHRWKNAEYHLQFLVGLIIGQLQHRITAKVPNVDLCQNCATVSFDDFVEDLGMRVNAYKKLSRWLLLALLTFFLDNIINDININLD